MASVNNWIVNYLGHSVVEQNITFGIRFQTTDVARPVTFRFFNSDSVYNNVVADAEKVMEQLPPGLDLDMFADAVQTYCDDIDLINIINSAS